MQLIHGPGYSNEEREAFKEIIYSNTIQSMRVILEAMKTMTININNSANNRHSEVIFALPAQVETDVFPPEAHDAIVELWQDKGVKECYGRKTEYQLNDSAK
jgi:guanine nucleotide-binding protein G(i) subunit alpha